MRSRSSPRAASSGRSSTSRSARSARSARRSTPTARSRTRATSSTTPSRSACSARTRCSARRSTPSARRSRVSQHVLTFDDLDDLARARPRLRGRASRRPARGWRRDRGGGPLHLHLHLRHDRPAEGLHDLAPQLLRHGRGRRRPAELHRPRGHDAPLPPARAQLRAADAPLRRVRGLRDRVPARPAPGRGRPGAGEADRLPERAARLREDPHGRRGEVRRDTGASRKLVDWALRVGRRVSELRRAGEPVPRGLAAAVPARRQARLLEGEGAPRRPAAARDLRRRATLATRSPSSSTRSTSCSSRATG